MRIKTAGLVGIYLLAIVLANLALTHWGSSAIIPDAFVLIGLDLITRDRLADFWGTTRWAKMVCLIAAGGALSYLVNDGAAQVAIASTVSFAAAETTEAVAYYFLRAQRWPERAPKSALFGAAVDSVAFPTLAFGAVSFSTSFTQFAAKLAGAAVWTWIVAGLLPPPSMASESA